MNKSILFIATGLGRGGAETQLVRLAIHLKNNGWDVEIITMLDRRDFDDELRRQGIPLHCLDMPRGIPDPRGLFETMRLIREQSPSVVVTFMLHANTMGRIAAKLSGVPVVVTSIRNEQFGGRLGDLAERVLSPLADAVTTNSELAANSISTRGVIDRADIEVIPNGLDFDEFDTVSEDTEKVRAKLDVAPGDFLWLAVGHLRLQKDFRHLLTTLTELLDQRRTGLQLRLVGRGPQRDELEARRRDLGLEDHVELLGFREDVPDLMAAADGFVLSSAWEGLPNVVMEAMAAELPVVATDVGGVSELVDDGETGLLVPPHDVATLADAMSTIMDYPEEHRRQMGRKGRTFVHEHFEAHRVFSRWEQLFEDLLDDRVPSTVAEG